MLAPRPAPCCTSTSTPCDSISRTPSGVSATRRSSSLTSVGTPTVRVTTPFRDPLARARTHGGSTVELLPGLQQHLVQRARDRVELVLAGHEGRRQLDHRVPTVVGPADQPELQQP